MRPAQWLKNGVVFAGLVFGGKLLEPAAVASATLAALAFCLLSSGFYLINDVRDRDADRLHPVKRMRPVPAGELASRTAGVLGSLLIIFAIVASALLSWSLLLVFLAYAGLMAAYNLGREGDRHTRCFRNRRRVCPARGGRRDRGRRFHIALAAGLHDVACPADWIRKTAARAGCARQREGASSKPGRIQPGRCSTSRVAVTAAGTLIAYAVYTFDSESAQYHHRMMLTIPIVAYGVFRYLYLLYLGGQGGAPETMLLTDRPLVAVRGDVGRRERVPVLFHSLSRNDRTNEQRGRSNHPLIWFIARS